MTGNYKGSEGRILRVIPGKNRVVIEGINMRTRHQRPSQANPEGGIVTFEAPIDVSNVMLVCTKCDTGVRIRTKILADKTKTRVCTQCGEMIERR